MATTLVTLSFMTKLEEKYLKNNCYLSILEENS